MFDNNSRDPTGMDESHLARRPDFFPEKPLWTPEIERQIDLVVEWVNCDLPGAHMWGVQRVGKSEFARYLAHVVPVVLDGTVATVVWSFLGFTPKTADDVLRKCLIDTGGNAIATRDQPVLRLRLVTAIAEKCKALRARRVLIVLDEIQNIPVHLYGAIMGVTADLLTKGVLSHLLTIGQPEMLQTVETLHTNRELQTIGRLFPTSSEFHGLSIDEVKELLANMDGETNAFTQLHFPERASTGWGVAELYSLIDQALIQLVKMKNLTETPPLPLGYLRPVLNRIFHYLRDNPTEALGASYVLDCITFSGFPKVAEYYVNNRRA